VREQPVALDYTRFAAAGIDMIVRLNFGYADGTGTLPPPDQLPAFEEAVIVTMRSAKGVTAFQYGNEINNRSEWPAGHPLTPKEYIASYNRVWNRTPLKIKMGPSPIDPYFGPGSNNRLWWVQILSSIRGADVLFLHSKTQSNNPAEVNSFEKFGNSPLKWQYLHFRTIQTSLEVVPARFRKKSIYLAEVNPQRITPDQLGWLPDNTEWIVRAKAHMARWNATAGHQQIDGMIFYRWDDDDWRLRDKPKLLAEIFH
jgi:hypothetical protein